MKETIHVEYFFWGDRSIAEEMTDDVLFECPFLIIIDQVDDLDHDQISVLIDGFFWGVDAGVEGFNGHSKSRTVILYTVEFKNIADMSRIDQFMLFL